MDAPASLQPLRSVKGLLSFIPAGCHDCSPAVHTSNPAIVTASLQMLLRMEPHLESLKANAKGLRDEVTANRFSEKDLQLRWDQRCHDLEDLKVVSRDGLRRMGLEDC